MISGWHTLLQDGKVCFQVWPAREAVCLPISPALCFAACTWVLPTVSEACGGVNGCLDRELASARADPPQAYSRALLKSSPLCFRIRRAATRILQTNRSMSSTAAMQHYAAQTYKTVLFKRCRFRRFKAIVNINGAGWLEV
jgi:hypothetical protein